MANPEDAATLLDSIITATANRLDCHLPGYYPDSTFRPTAGPQRFLFPTGPCALGLWSPEDEIHLVVLSDNIADTFWSFAAERLDLEVLPDSVDRHARLEVEEGVWVHYCAMPQGFDLATVSGYGFPTYAKDAFQPTAVRANLDTLRDTKHLLDQCSSQVPVFRAAYSDLRQWAQAAGIWSREFSMLDPDVLTWIIYAVQDWKQQGNRVDVVKAALKLLQDTPNLVTLLTPTSGRNITSPHANLSMGNRNAIAAAATVALQELPRLHRGSEKYFPRFLDSDQTIQIKAWCFSPKSKARLEAALVNLIITFRERLMYTGQKDAGNVRVWPYPSCSDDGTEWLYLLSMDGPKVPAAAVQQVNTVFLSTISKMGGASISLIESFKKAEYLAYAEQMTYQTSQRPSRTLNNYLGAVTAKPDTANTETAPSLIASTNGKRPSASQVLSRLRWDPAYADDSYEVGYCDRFEGIKWLPLELWGKATEEEDFIPEHRIRMFRKVGAGKEGMVWERIGPEGKVWSGS